MIFRIATSSSIILSSSSLFFSSLKDKFISNNKKSIVVQHNKGARKALGTSNGSTHESRSDRWHGTRSKRTKSYYCKECDDHLDEDEAYFYKGAWGPFCKECIIERDGEFDDIVWRPASECR